MFDKLIGVEERFVEVEKHLSDPKIINDRNAYQTYVREHAELSKIVTVYRQYTQTLLDIDESQDLLKDADPDIKDLARDEIATLNRVKENLEAELKKLLLPKDPMMKKTSSSRSGPVPVGKRPACLPVIFIGCTAAMQKAATGK